MEDTEHINEVAWCPDCQSPPKSDFAHVQYCSRHQPGTSGELDRLVSNTDYIFQGEGGDGNSVLLDFIHGRRKENA